MDKTTSKSDSHKKFSLKCCLCDWIEPTAFLFNLYYVGYMTLLSQLIKHMIDTQRFKHSNQFNYKFALNSFHPNLTDTKMCEGSVNLLEESVTLAETSRVLIYANIVAIFPSLFVAIMMGGYSDSQGRLDIMMMNLTGAAIQVIVILIMAICDLSVYFVILSTLITGLVGMDPTFWFASYAYISDITKNENRSNRLVVFEIFSGLGSILANLIIGHLISTLGFVWSLIFLLFIIFLTMLYVCILKESLKTKYPSEKPLLSFKYFSEVYKLYTKKDLKGRNWNLLLILGVIFLAAFVEYGSLKIIVLYIIRYPFCLNPTFVGYFLTLLFTSNLSCNWSVTKLLGSFLGDSGLALLGSISGMLFFIVFAATTSKDFLFAVPFIGCFLLLPTIILKSLASKIVEPEKIGLLFGSITWAELLGRCIGNIVQNGVFALTVKSKPYSFLVLNACVLGLAVILLIVFIVKDKLESAVKEEQMKIVD